MESKNGNGSKELALVSKLSQPDTDVLKLDLSQNLEGSLKLLTSLVKSKKLGEKVTTPEIALGYYIKSKELGLPFMSSVDHMFNVGGTTNIDVHLMRAMVLRAGVVTWKEVYNFAPLYKYIDSTGQLIATGFNTSCLPDTYELVQGDNKEEMKADSERIKGIGRTPVAKRADVINLSEGMSVINRGTEYEFNRLIKFSNGQEHIITENGKFTLGEAFYAGLHTNKKGEISMSSPWLVYPRNMLEHRAWTFGCRKIADDITFGIMERSEYLDTQKIDYTIDDGKPTVINSESTSK